MIQGLRRTIEGTTLVFLLLPGACARQSATIAPVPPAPTQAAAEPARIGGRWEGEIATARRPIVMFVDFDAQHARLSATGSTTIPVHDLRSDSSGTSFELRLGRDTIAVRARDDDGALRGVVTLAGDERSLFLRRLPELALAATREEAWRQDLDVVLSRFLPYDRSFTPAAREAFRRRLAELSDSVPQLHDNEMMVRLARAVALSENAHTRLYLVRNRSEVRRMPIRIWEFSDGYHVVRATADHRALLGCRLTHVQGLEIAVAAARVRGIKPGNAQWQRYMSGYMLTSPEMLNGTGVSGDADSVRHQFSCAGAQVARTLVPLPLERSSATTESWWDLSPASSLNTATRLAAISEERLPLYLREPAVHYWFEQLPGSGILYFQYNRSQNVRDGESLRDFGVRLLAAADRPDVRALVVDLRFNTGGNLDIATPLMTSLQDKFAGKPVYVITGRATFSAGITHAVQWKQGGATFVGEPVGDELDTWGEGGNVELPNSKLVVHFANGFHGYSQREYPELRPYYMDGDVATLAPDHPVELTWAEYAAGRDPAMDLIERLLTAQ